jgi:serine protease Do
MSVRQALQAALLAVVFGPLAAGSASAQEPSGPAAVAAIQDAVVDAIARSERSVVAIARVRKDAPGASFGLEFRPDPFGRAPMPTIEPKPTDPEFIPNEFATGVVVDPRGLILTAYHVLGEDSDYYVTTHERKVYKATVKGADPRSDLAVLEIDAKDLEPVRFGDADSLRKGQFVIALGNPYAIARDGQVSASWGIVANLARKAPPSIDESEFSRKSTLHQFGTLIQTDAKLNLGTSGGALLDLKGQMVGLTTALAATAGYEQSAGYAYPVDATFRRVVETLKQGREVEYGYLGIQPGNLPSQDVLAGLGGTRVYAVLPGTPANKYGLQVGDMITSVDGRPVYDADSLVLFVGRLPVESVVRLGVLRNNRPVDVDVTLSKYPVRGRKIVTTPAPDWRGLRVDYLTAVLDPAGRVMFDSPAMDSAVAVVEVEEGSPAWQAGFRPKDLISRVEKKPVTTPREFFAAVIGKTGPVRLTVADPQGAAEATTRTVEPGS